VLVGEAVVIAHPVHCVVLPLLLRVVGSGLEAFVASVVVVPVESVAKAVSIGSDWIVHPDLSVPLVVAEAGGVGARVVNPGVIADRVVPEPGPGFIGRP